jgi:hypothetical protein
MTLPEYVAENADRRTFLTPQHVQVGLLSDGKTPEDVAKDWLVSEGFVK